MDNEDEVIIRSYIDDNKVDTSITRKQVDEIYLNGAPVYKRTSKIKNEDYDRLNMFLARVNKVASYHRHGLPIPKRALDTLSNEHIDMEKWLEEKKSNLTQENQK
jgi:hypothetical protein